MGCQDSWEFPPFLALTQFLQSAGWEQPELAQGCPFSLLWASPSPSSSSPETWDVGKMGCQNLKGLEIFFFFGFVSQSYPNNP